MFKKYYFVEGRFQSKEKLQPNNQFICDLCVFSDFFGSTMAYTI